MELQDFVAIARHEPALRFLIVGGYDVAAHGHTRATFDVDFLVSKEDRQKWLQRLLDRGFQLISETAAFAQFSPPDKSTGLDLMFVAEPLLSSSGPARNRRSSEQRRPRFQRSITCWL
jgi:hypothetical protein